MTPSHCDKLPPTLSWGTTACGRPQRRVALIRRSLAESIWFGRAKSIALFVTAAALPLLALSPGGGKELPWPALSQLPYRKVAVVKPRR